MPAGGGAYNRVRLQWYQTVLRWVAFDLPTEAHRVGAVSAARAAALSIHSTYSGSLSRDLSRPRFLGPLHSRVGSERSYARIEARGGIIRPVRAQFLAIRGRGIGAEGQGKRSTFGGPITATVGPGRGKGYVVHHGKKWDVAAVAAFRQSWEATARSLFRRGGHL